jgi:hypothetical protein
MTAALEHKPRLKGDHPYRTTTKFQRNADGSFARDAEGYLVPIVPPKDELREKQESTPEERADARARIAAKLEEENRAMEKLNRQVVGRTATGVAVRRGKRQDIGDPDCRLSESEDFPLLAVLRRDKAQGMIASVLAYRRLVALCEAEPLKGQSYGQTTGMEREYETRRMRGVEEVNEAASKGFKGKLVPGGEVVYERRVRKSDGAYDIPAKRVLPAEVSDDGTTIGGRTESLHIKLNEDTLADYIDSKPRLEKIRAALGPLLEPVEDAVLGGQTLEKIGKDQGMVGREAISAGKALVYRGLTVLDGYLGAQKHVAANDNYLIENRKIA